MKIKNSQGEFKTPEQLAAVYSLDNDDDDLYFDDTGATDFDEENDKDGDDE